LGCCCSWVRRCFEERRRWWRIDYLFKSADFSTIRCQPVSCHASDHLALLTVLRWRL
jgi:endonuclease/exonuclease/phosphatase family metal-dependent hydrolase